MGQADSTGSEIRHTGVANFRRDNCVGINPTIQIGLVLWSTMEYAVTKDSGVTGVEWCLMHGHTSDGPVGRIGE